MIKFTRDYKFLLKLKIREWQLPGKKRFDDALRTKQQLLHGLAETEPARGYFR